MKKHNYHYQNIQWARKTTLALRAISLLNDEYTPYQIIRCNNNAELGHIVEYFRMRTRIGEKPLILLDNLDAHLSEWNLLAQLMQTGVTYHYKLLITSRENDWYNYGGDISNLHHLQIIKPILNEKEAENIYSVLKKRESCMEILLIGKCVVKDCRTSTSYRVCVSFDSWRDD